MASDCTCGQRHTNSAATTKLINMGNSGNGHAMASHTAIPVIRQTANRTNGASTFLILLLSFHREQTVELGVDHVGHLLQVIGIVAELTGVAVDDDELALIAIDPLLITAL